mgnify:CR=1 FL=1
MRRRRRRDADAAARDALLPGYNALPLGYEQGGQPTETAASSGPRPYDGRNSAYQVVAAAWASAVPSPASVYRATRSRSRAACAPDGRLVVSRLQRVRRVVD